MSDTLPLHTGRKADYKEIMRLIVPFSSSAGAQRRLKRRPRLRQTLFLRVKHRSTPSESF